MGWRAMRGPSFASALASPGRAPFRYRGSLAWSERVGYGYGLSSCEALSRHSFAPELYVLIVGDGAGRAKLKPE